MSEGSIHLTGYADGTFYVSWSDPYGEDGYEEILKGRIVQDTAARRGEDEQGTSPYEDSMPVYKLAMEALSPVLKILEGGKKN